MLSMLPTLSYPTVPKQVHFVPKYFNFPQYLWSLKKYPQFGSFRKRQLIPDLGHKGTKHMIFLIFYFEILQLLQKC